MVDKILTDYISKNMKKFSVEELKKKALAGGVSEQGFNESLNEALKNSSTKSTKNNLLYSSFAGFVLFGVLAAYFFIPSIHKSVDPFIIFCLSILLLFIFSLGFISLGKNFGIHLLKKSSYFFIVLLFILAGALFIFYFFQSPILLSLAGDATAEAFLEGVISYSGEGLFDLSQFSSEAYSTFLKRETINLDISAVIWGGIVFFGLAFFILLSLSCFIGLGIWKLRQRDYLVKISSCTHILFSLGFFIFSGYIFYKFIYSLINLKVFVSFLIFMDDLIGPSWEMILIKTFFLLLIFLESYMFFTFWREK